VQNNFPSRSAPVSPCFIRGDRRRRWGVVLAGGEGVRLRPLTRFICGDERPKQFCPIFDGGVSLLQRTLTRSVRSIPADQTLFAVTRIHQRFYLSDLAGQECRLIVQPADRGTAPAILASLLSIVNMDGDALVVIMPSDHHFSDESLFTKAIESGFDIAAESESVMLLAAPPTHADVEYGWIETVVPASKPEREGVFRIRAFHEKPATDRADLLFRQGSLWNTFVMIGHVRAFLSLIQDARPDLFAALSKIRFRADRETHIADSVYEKIASADFSGQVLAARVARLLALRFGAMGWSDLGDPARVVAALSTASGEPGWVRPWLLSMQSHPFAVAVAVGAA